MAWYRQGSVSVTNGSKVVTGSGTAWAANVQAGDAFHAPDGKTYEIDFVGADASMNLVDNYAGTTASGQSYKVQPTQGRVRDLAAAVSTLITEYGSIENALTVLSGNVGIGTASPAAKFVVSASGNAGYEVSPSSGIGGGPLLASYDRSAAAYKQVSHYALAHMWWSGSFGRAMDLDSNGNLGIGTSSPAAKLDVTANDVTLALRDPRDGAAAPTAATKISFYRHFGVNEVGRISAVGTSASGNPLNEAALVFSIANGTGLAERLRIDAPGNMIPVLTDAPPTLTTARQMVFTRVNDTQVRLSMRGADGTTRSTTLTLA